MPENSLAQGCSCCGSTRITLSHSWDSSINTMCSFSSFPISPGSKNSTGRQHQHQLSQQPQPRRRLVVLVATSDYRKFFLMVAKNVTFESIYIYVNTTKNVHRKLKLANNALN